MIHLSIAHAIMKIIRTYRCAILPREESWQKVREGFWMKILPYDFMDVMFLFGTYEPILVHIISKVIKRGDLCIDIGAHKGYITMVLAKAVGEHGKVIAVDPDFNAINCLIENSKKNNFKHITVCNIALGDNEGECDFCFSKQIGWSSRFPNDIAKPHIQSISKIKVTTLDLLLFQIEKGSNSKNLSFIKIDAEGSEPLIIKGMLRCLTTYHPIIWIEINKNSLGNAGFSTKMIQEPLTEEGYRFYKIHFRRNSFLRPILSFEQINDLESNIAQCDNIIAISSKSLNFENVSTNLALP